MKRFLFAFALILSLGFTSTFAADAPTVVDVWPGKPPGETRKEAPEELKTSNIQRISNVFKPTLTIYHAPKDKDTGAAIIICPGGGYGILAWDLEGTEVAQRLNESGITGIVLKYRVPAKRTNEVHGFIPLMDAQRAISLVRSKAKEWNIDPKRIGILGFSAGGNLSALACTNYESRSYEGADDVDKESCRPDFGVLIYPAYLLIDKTDQLNPNIPVTSNTPPIFFAHANDDGITAAGSATMYLALKKAGVASEIHIYAHGGHGFGLRKTKNPCYTWPDRCVEWMGSVGLLKAGT